MSWKCVRCGKEFAKDNQSHICENVDTALLFNGKEEQVFVLYLVLLERIEAKMKTIVTATQKSITFYAESRRSFFVISPKRKHLVVWFALDHRIEKPWVTKIIQSSKSKYVHVTKISDAHQINRRLITLVGKAYKLVSD